MTSALLHNLPPGLAGADCAGQAAAGRAVQSSGPLRWFRRADVRRAFLDRQALRRWTLGLSPEQVERVASGTIRGVRGDAVLPRWGKTVAEFVQEKPFGNMHKRLRGATENSRRLNMARAVVAGLYQDFCRQRPELRDRESRTEEFQRVHGPRLDEIRRESGFKLPVGRVALRSALEGRIDGRSRSGQKRQELFDPEVFQEAIGLRLHRHQLKVNGAYSIYAYCQAKAAREGKLWSGSRNTFAARLKEAVPEACRKLGQRGAWEYERDCVPKLVRDRSVFAPGEFASLDGRDCDQLVRVPASTGGWRAVRPVEVVFFDEATGFPMGWYIAAQESADVTLLAVRHMHDRVGLPRVIITDNGKGFICALGSHGRRKWPAEDVRRSHALCEYLHLDVDHKVPKRAWAKTAETRFSRIKEIDRLSPYFIGGSPDERPEDVLRRVKLDIMQVPTLDEFRRQREADYELFANTFSPALGGSPRQIFEAYPREVRKTDPEFLRFACSHLAGGPNGRLVRRDGVQFGGKGIVYGRTDEEVHKLQGRRVWLRIDPADLSEIWLCDERGAPLCLATRSDLEGVTAEHSKEAHKRLARMRKADREFVAQHAFFRATAIGQVRQVLGEHRRAEAAEYQRAHAPPAPLPAALIGSEHIPAVKKGRAGARRQETRRRLQAGVGAVPEPGSEPIKTGLELLSARAHERPEPAAEAECVADRLRRFAHAG